MTIRKIEMIEKIAHPLEEYFNIDSGSTEMVRTERKTDIIPYEEYDHKDSELENTYQEIYDTAMSGYDTLRDIMDTADTKVVARLAEVGVQHLNAALAAASKKAQLKENKDKMIAKEKSSIGKNVTNNIVIAGNRNDILKQALAALDGRATEVLDAEIIESKD